MPEAQNLWEAKVLIYALGCMDALLGAAVIFFLNELYKGIKECSRGVMRLEHDLIAIKVKLRILMANGGDHGEHKRSGISSERIQ